MLIDDCEEEESKSSKNNKIKRLLVKQQQQQQISNINNNKSPFPPSNNISAQMKRMSYRSAGDGAKKNQNVKLLDNVKIHNFWSNIFRRKTIISSYFSEAAFGSEADKKIEYRVMERSCIQKEVFTTKLSRFYIENELK